MTSEQIHETDLPEFNLFNVLGVWHLERQHSEVIAWLLDPSCSHGLYDAFLRLFLTEARVQARARGIETPFLYRKLRDTEVEREKHGIDILLVNRTSKFVCLIENKMFSEEHSNQLARYLKQVQRNQEFKGFTPIPVFLTREGNKPQKLSDQRRYLTFSYSQIVRLIDKVRLTHASNMNSEIQMFLTQYVDAVRKYVLLGSDFLSKPIQVIDYENYYEGLQGASRQFKLNAVLLSRPEWHSGRQLMSSLQKAGHDFSESWVASRLHWYSEWKRINF